MKRQQIFSAVCAAAVTASCCICNVTAGTTNASPELLPERTEAILAEALGTEDYVYYLFDEVDEELNFTNRVTVLTETQSYALTVLVHDNLVTVTLDPSVQWVQFEIHCQTDRTAELEQLTGDIARLEQLKNPEPDYTDESAVFIDTTYAVYMDEDGTVYPYGYTLRADYSDAAPEEKAKWAWDTYHALADMDDVRFAVWNLNYMEGSEIGRYAVVPEFGDVNQDGSVDVKDAQAALVAAGDIRLGLTPSISAEKIAAADVDGDGSCTVKDAQFILMYYADTRAGIACSWRTLTGNPDAPAGSSPSAG